MVFFFYPRGYDDGKASGKPEANLIYMGRDKYENEELIKYGARPLGGWGVGGGVWQRKGLGLAAAVLFILGPKRWPAGGRGCLSGHWRGWALERPPNHPRAALKPRQHQKPKPNSARARARAHPYNPSVQQACPRTYGSTWTTCPPPTCTCGWATARGWRVVVCFFLRIFFAARGRGGGGAGRSFAGPLLCCPAARCAAALRGSLGQALGLLHPSNSTLQPPPPAAQPQNNHIRAT